MSFVPWSKEAALRILATMCDEPGPILICLQALQTEFGYIPEDAVALVADACNVSRADVHGVLTYYHDLRTSVPPQSSIRICVAEACQAVGSRELVTAAEGAFGTTLGAPNDLVEIEPAYCFGNCALGPAAMVDHQLIGRASLEKLLAAVQGDEDK